jgi:dCMP deaminase
MIQDSLAKWSQKSGAGQLTDTDVKLELVVHAEVNALIAAGARSIGSTLYVWGKPICARCAGPIIQSGVKRIVALSPDSVPNTSKWHQTGKYAYDMFIEASIEVDFYTVANGE